MQNVWRLTPFGRHYSERSTAGDALERHLMTTDSNEEIVSTLIRNRALIELAEVVKVMNDVYDDNESYALTVWARTALVKMEDSVSTDFVLNLPARLKIILRRLSRSSLLHAVPGLRSRSKTTIPRLDPELWGFLADKRMDAIVDEDRDLLRSVDKCVRLGDRISEIIRRHPDMVDIDVRDRLNEITVPYRVY